MDLYAAEMNFEKAAEYRDLINSVNIINEEQLVEDFDSERRDYISYLSEDKFSAFVVLQMRSGNWNRLGNLHCTRITRIRSIQVRKFPFQFLRVVK